VRGAGVVDVVFGVVFGAEDVVAFGVVFGTDVVVAFGTADVTDTPSSRNSSPIGSLI